MTTARLTIRRLNESDLEGFLAYQSDPRVREFMPGEPMDRPKAEASLRRQADLRDTDRDVYHSFAVLLGEELIGDVGLYLPSGLDLVGDLGFQFHPEYQGLGYATEAATALIQYGFGTLGLTRITSNCDPRNTASYRLMERLGMSRVSSPGDKSLTYELNINNVFNKGSQF